MVAIGRALMARPKLLLLDEPSMGLAPIFVERIFEIIRRSTPQGTPILLVEQNALMALDVANRGYVLETGTIALADDAKRLKENEQVQKTYLGVDYVGRRLRFGRSSGTPPIAVNAARPSPSPAAPDSKGSRRRRGSRSAVGGRSSRGPSSGRRRCRASGRSRAGARRPRRGSRRRGRAPGGRARAGTRPSPRTAAADGTCARSGTPRSRARPSGAAARPPPSARDPRPLAGRVEERAVRLLRRMREVPLEAGAARIAVPPSATGKASRQRRSASPSPSVAPSSGFGRSRGRYGVVRGTPMHTASSGRSSVVPRSSTARSSASACATDGGPA